MAINRNNRIDKKQRLNGRFTFWEKKHILFYFTDFMCLIWVYFLYIFFFWFVGILVFFYSIKIIFLYTSAIFDIKSIFWHKFHASMKFSDNFNTWSVMYSDNIRKRMQISHKKSIECSVQFQCKMRNNIFALSHKRSKQKKRKTKDKEAKKTGINKKSYMAYKYYLNLLLFE